MSARPLLDIASHRYELPFCTSHASQSGLLKKSGDVF
ncbi:hypothetical protein WJX74_007328 [Apatococcus lobatus]|uniref:Uncharacterized protein n=1 Tax=Apatococcus lobatus TaxID=904363 RepID=A0AAW1SCK7_9CHLO